jgi:allantoin racemase
MRLWVINPNSTQAMTDTIADAAASVAPPGAEIVARTNRAGPPAIQGEADGMAAVPGVLDEVRAGLAAGADGFVLACFDDTGLAEARALAAPRPVVGIGQAAFHAAALSGGRFSVVTTLPVSLPVIEANLRGYGLDAACVKVRASGVPVLALEETPETADPQVAAEVAAALAEDRPGAVVLGCAGMARLAEPFTARFGVPVIDGVRAAVLLAWSMARLAGRG